MFHVLSILLLTKAAANLAGFGIGGRFRAAFSFTQNPFAQQFLIQSNNSTLKPFR